MNTAIPSANHFASLRSRRVSRNVQRSLMFKYAKIRSAHFPGAAVSTMRTSLGLPCTTSAITTAQVADHMTRQSVADLASLLFQRPATQSQLRLHPGASTGVFAQKGVSLHAPVVVMRLRAPKYKARRDIS
jgi:hypothetical protein